MPYEQFIKIYAADVTVLEDDALYQSAYQLSTLERREKADRFHFPADRWRSLGAELLLHFGLDRLGLKSAFLVYGYHDHGKPYLLKYPEIHFSLSHSGDFAVCAISSKEVGCDIEKVSGKNTKVANHFFSKNEVAFIDAQIGQDAKNDMFFRLWTLKESFLKLTGQGLSIPLDSFCINIDQDRINVVQQYNEWTYHFREYSIRKGYKCSVCGLEPIPEDTCEIIDLKSMLNNYR